MSAPPAAPPLWRDATPAEPERTLEGVEIIMTRFGRFIRQGEHFIPYVTDEELRQKLTSRPRPTHHQAQTSWPLFSTPRTD